MLFTCFQKRASNRVWGLPDSGGHRDGQKEGGRQGAQSQEQREGVNSRQGGGRTQGAAAGQKSAWRTQTREEGVNSALHRGHSGFWLPHSAMHGQQKTWPQGVAVGCARADKHSGHLRLLGTSRPLGAASTDAAPGEPAGPAPAHPLSSGSGLPSSDSTAACRAMMALPPACCPPAAVLPLLYRLASHITPLTPSWVHSSRPSTR